MIFHDRITVLIETPGEGYDDLGNPNPGTTEEVLYGAEVRPLATSEKVNAQSQVESRYTVFVSRAAEGIITPESAIRWRGRMFEVEGDVEPHMVLGRCHHLEFIGHRTTG